MHVSHLVPSLEERHGGPSKSVRALANAQAVAGAEVGLLSTAEPSAGAPILTEDRARMRIFPRLRPLSLCRSPALRSAVLAEPVQVIHHHSLWLLTLRYAHEASRLHRCPLVIAPRGMLSPWARGHHGWRKTLAGKLIHPGALAAAAGWHATSRAEADDLRRLGFRQPICVAPNGVSLPPAAELDASRQAWLQSHPALQGRRVAVFYSRLHRKKRVAELLALWAAQPRGDWTLLVAGIPEEYTAAQLQQLPEANRTASPVVIADSVGLPPPYAVGELFLLPSHSENFGLVIAEALAAGLPAVVTDGTPWSDLAPHRAGDCVPWERYPETLAAWLDRSPAELSAAGAQARQLVAHDYTWEQSARRLLDFYAELTHA